MLKILYAAGYSRNSRIQLSRFLAAVEDKPYQIKIAAFKRFSPKINIDYTLDFMYNQYDLNAGIEGLFSSRNENIKIYFEIIKSLKPDLIISDMEYFTSYIAMVLNIKLWQCSSSIINFAFKNPLFKKTPNKYCSELYCSEYNKLKIKNLIINSDKIFVYSHLGDIITPPELVSGYEYVRPYSKIGMKNMMCKHHIVATMTDNKKIISYLKKYRDCVLFSNNNTGYRNIINKDLEDSEEYFCNLMNCDLFVTEGQESFLADAYYNEKHALVFPTPLDVEGIMSSGMSELNHLCSCNEVYNTDPEFLMNKKIKVNFNNIKYLHEKIDELI
jgi:hypothetical protein